MSEDGNVGLGSIDAPEYLRPIYANFANVNHTPYDFRITFALVTAPRPGAEVEQAQAAGAVHPQAVADIIVPVSFVQGLIGALRENYDSYLAAHGVPGLRELGEEGEQP